MGTSRASKNLIYKAMGVPKYIGSVAKKVVNSYADRIEGQMKAKDASIDDFRRKNQMTMPASKADMGM